MLKLVMPDLIRHPGLSSIPAFAGMTVLAYMVAGVISFTWKGEDGMIGKKTLGLMVVLALLLMIAEPVAAAERTFHLDNPSCSA
jgi:hypothetical protein